MRRYFRASPSRVNPTFSSRRFARHIAFEHRGAEAVQRQPVEGEGQQPRQRVGHEPAAGEGRARPIAEIGALADAPAHLAERNAADEGVAAALEDEESIAAIGAGGGAVDAQAAHERLAV